MSLDFLSPSPGAIARSPMERDALAACARLGLRDGWNVAVAFDEPESERERLRSSVGFADHSHLSKIELHGRHELPLGQATRRDGAWWCPYTPERAIRLSCLGVAGEPLDRTALDVTTAFAALTIAGPLAREVFARFTAIDLRDSVAPVGAFRPGSVARTPGAILREGEERWLMLFGAALGSYMWTVVADAAGSLGGGPVGTEVFAELAAHA